jgi:hypothetical protein
MRFWLIVLLVLALFTAGCLTTNMFHNVEHFRAFRDNLGELHEDVDKYLME